MRSEWSWLDPAAVTWSTIFPSFASSRTFTSAAVATRYPAMGCCFPSFQGRSIDTS